MSVLVIIDRQLFTNVFPRPLLWFPPKSQLIQLVGAFITEFAVLEYFPLIVAPRDELWVSLVRQRYIAVTKLLFEFHKLILKNRKRAEM